MKEKRKKKKQNLKSLENNLSKNYNVSENGITKRRKKKIKFWH